MRSRLFKSFVGIITFMVIVMGMMYFSVNPNKVRNLAELASDMHQSARMLSPVYIRYDKNPANTTKPTRSSWSAFGFLKVHKAASTTTQGIFLRYGWKRNLTFVLPPEYNFFQYPNIISLNESITSYNILPPPSGKSFDILCHHVIYDKLAWDKVLSPDAAKIGTVREPFSHFKSTLNYFRPGFLKKIQTANPVRTYLQNPQRFEIPNVRWSFTNNRMSFAYGVDPQIIYNRDFQKFSKYLWDVIDKEFTAVLVNERYDESLIIMRRKLSWELKDILYVSLNVGSRKSDPYNLTKEDQILHQKFNVFDYSLYSFFSERLEHDIANAQRFDDELNHFRKVKDMLHAYCLNVGRSQRVVLAVGRSEWNEPFNVTVRDCQLMKRAEIPFTQDIRRKQYGNATWTWRT